MGTTKSREVDRLIALVNDVLSGESTEGFGPIMAFLVDLFKTQGAIVWEVGPEANLEEENPKGRVFVLAAQTPPDVNAVFSEIPLEASMVGRAIIENTVQNSADIWNDQRVYQSYPPLKQARVQRLLATPVDVPGGGKGVVSLYATKGRRPFSNGFGPAAEFRCSR